MPVPVHHPRIQEVASNKPNASTAFNLPNTGAATGMGPFNGRYTNGQTCTYDADNPGGAWESGIGTFTTGSPNTLVRTTIHKSSNSDAAVDWSAGGDVTVSVQWSADNANKFENLAGAFGLGNEISVTGAVTATIGHMHHCTGTSANYTVTLPAASGNAGKLLGFRMGSAAGLTKLVTLDGNASEAIDGSLTRVMWATETAILLCDGSNWFKIAGKAIPMVCTMYKAADQTSFPTTVETLINLDTTLIDNTGAMISTGSNQITTLRGGNYLVGVSGLILCSTSAALAYTSAKVGSTYILSSYGGAFGSSTYAAMATTKIIPLVTGDVIKLYGYQNSGATQTVKTGPTSTGMSLMEVPQW